MALRAPCALRSRSPGAASRLCCVASHHGPRSSFAGQNWPTRMRSRAAARSARPAIIPDTAGAETSHGRADAMRR